LQPEYPYTPVQIASLEKTISPARFSTYQRLSGGDAVNALRFYYWNMALGQSLHIPIQSLEVSLRNTISNAINSLFGQDWYLQALNSLYNSMLEVTGWICLDTRDWVEHYCDFDTVYNNRP
jgi:hypothetical protein